MTLGQFSVIFGVFNLNKMYKYILSDCGQFNYYILLLQKKSLWTSHKPPPPPDERKRDYICFVIIYRLCGSTGWCHRHQVRLWFYFLGGGMAGKSLLPWVIVIWSVKSIRWLINLLIEIYFVPIFRGVRIFFTFFFFFISYSTPRPKS